MKMRKRFAAHLARGSMDVARELLRCALACSAFIVVSGMLSISGAYARMSQGARLFMETALTVLCFGATAAYGLWRAWNDPHVQAGRQALSAGQLRYLALTGVLLVCPMTLVSDLLRAPFVRMGSLASASTQVPTFALFLPMLVKSALIAPICEELFFRGYLTAVLRASGTKGATLIAALFFALAHGVDAALLPRFAMGLLLGALAVRVDSLLAAVVVHACYNLTILVLSFAGVGGLFSGIGFVSCLIRVPLCAAFVVALRAAYSARRARRTLCFGERMTRRQIALLFAALALVMICPLLAA